MKLRDARKPAKIRTVKLPFLKRGVKALLVEYESAPKPIYEHPPDGEQKYAKYTQPNDEITIVVKNGSETRRYVLLSDCAEA